MSATTGSIPDLLRRFAPAPHCASAMIGDIELELHTNDATLVAALRRAGTRNKNEGPAGSLRVKVIRDCDAPSGGSDETILSAWPLNILLVGTGTMLAMDCERREIIGFVAPAITGERFLQLLLMLLEYLHNGTARTAHSQAADLR